MKAEALKIRFRKERHYFPFAVIRQKSSPVKIRLSDLNPATVRWIAESLLQNNWLKALLLGLFPSLLSAVKYRPRDSFLVSWERVRVAIDSDKSGKFRVRYFTEKDQFLGPLQNKTLRRNIKIAMGAPPKNWNFKPRNEAKHVVSLAGRADHNFGHFMLEYLPRLRLVEQHLGSLDDVTVLLSSRLPWKVELLQEIGIKPAQLLVGTESFLAAPLYITDNSPVYMRDNEFKSENISWLREKLIAPNHSHNPSKVLYLRRDGSRRQLPREAELTMLDYGVEIVTPGSLSLSEKKDTLASARTIIGGVGSNLVNVILAPHQPETLIVSDGNFPPHVFHVLLELSGSRVSHLHFPIPGATQLDPEATTKVNLVALREELNRIVA